MGLIGKPKRVKLWKNSVTAERKKPSAVKVKTEQKDITTDWEVKQEENTEKIKQIKVESNLDLTEVKTKKGFKFQKMKLEASDELNNGFVKKRQKNINSTEVKVKTEQKNEISNWEVKQNENSKKIKQNGIEENMDLTETKPKKGFKRQTESQNFIPNKKRKLKAGDDLRKKNQKNIVNTSQSSTNKSYKPDNISGKEWKKLGLKKTSKSPTEIGDGESKTWRELHMKKKGKLGILEDGKTLKNLWNELRSESCKKERKTQLLKQVCDLIKGRAKEFTFAHDTVRVLECVLALGAETHRSLLFNELKDDFLTLVKSKYGKFFLIKMLKYGTKEHKEAIMKSFHGKVVKLLKHSEAAEVLELAFNEVANAKQRFEFIQEFFGATYKYFKVTDVHSLKELIEANPEKKSLIFQNMKTELMKVVEKSVVKHSIVHHVLWQFMQHCDKSLKSEIIESLREVIPEILHTRDGSRVGMHCIWFGSIKDRKLIVKSMKNFVQKIAVEEHGHMVLLAAFDAVDDTTLIEKYIIKGLVKDLLGLSQNVHGKKVLIYLLSPRNTHFFCPDIINILKVGDGNDISKKDPEVRYHELKSIIAKPLLQLIMTNIQNLYTDNAFCLFTCTILDHTVGAKKEAFESIVDLLEEPYTTENKNTHPIEHPGSSFMLKQLILKDKNTQDADCYFSDVLIRKVPKCVLSSWIECNRGAFLLVSLIETNIPAVVSRVKEELNGCKKHLAKKNFKGAEILLTKLKE